MWRKKRRSRPTAERLAEAERSVIQSKLKAHEELGHSTSRLEESRKIARALRAHNESNRYGDWLEEILTRAARGRA